LRASAAAMVLLPEAAGPSMAMMVGCMYDPLERVP
jgi:hypothetical protein